MIALDAKLTPADLAARVRAAVGARRAEDSPHRRAVPARRPVAGHHPRRPLRAAGLDRVDARLSVRRRAPGVRRHRRRGAARRSAARARARDMASHVTHFGVHDHGFNNVSTYGNLRRLILEGRLPHDAEQLEFYELALQASAAVQAARWSRTADGGGYIYSFNGPHSLFSDTMRSLRVLALGHLLGAPRAGRERRADRPARAAGEARAGDGRVQRVLRRGPRRLRRARPRGAREHLQHERRPLPLPEHAAGLLAVHHVDARPGVGDARLCRAAGVPRRAERRGSGSRTAAATAVEQFMLRAARATCDFYIEHTPTDGVPYWDTGAPGLVALGDYLARPADPFNEHEPVDSSAAAIACQGLLRLGRWLTAARRPAARRAVLAGRAHDAAHAAGARRTWPKIPQHDGLLLHTIYHRPRGWDYMPPGAARPARRGVHVGRLSPAGSGAVRRAHRPRAAVLRVLPAACDRVASRRVHAEYAMTQGTDAEFH